MNEISRAVFPICPDTSDKLTNQTKLISSYFPFRPHTSIKKSSETILAKARKASQNKSQYDSPPPRRLANSALGLSPNTLKISQNYSEQQKNIAIHQAPAFKLSPLKIQRNLHTKLLADNFRFSARPHSSTSNIHTNLTAQSNQFNHRKPILIKTVPFNNNSTAIDKTVRSYTQLEQGPYRTQRSFYEQEVLLQVSGRQEEDLPIIVRGSFGVLGKSSSLLGLSNNSRRGDEASGPMLISEQNKTSSSQIIEGHLHSPSDTVDGLSPPDNPGALSTAVGQSAVNNKLYKYVVNYGNNCTIVERVMSTRLGWMKIKPHDQAYNFRWCPTSDNICFERLGKGMKQLINHIDGHKELTCKFSLAKNLKEHTEATGSTGASRMPATFFIDFDDEKCENNLKKFSAFFLRHKPSTSTLALSSNKQVRRISSQNFAKNLRRLMSKEQYTAVDKSNRQKHRPTMHPSYMAGDNYFWFLKPTGTNRGRGIHIFNTLEQLDSLLEQFNVGIEEKPLGQQLQTQESIEKQKKPQQITDEKRARRNSVDDQQKSTQQRREGSQGNTSASYSNGNKEIPVRQKESPVSLIKCRQFVVQKYVERPMLIEGRKFDIRAWVLVSHQMEVFFFKESVIRTSGEQFQLNPRSIENLFVHLTNNAIQKYAENYGQFEEGNQLSLNTFFDYCHLNFPDCNTSKLHQSMKDIVIDSMQSIQRKLNIRKRKSTFEIYGYDFLVDEKFNVWLLEVNTNPCLDESSPHLQKTLPRLLDDAFKLTLDVLFPCTKIVQYTNTKQNIISSCKQSSQLQIIGIKKQTDITNSLSNLQTSSLTSLIQKDTILTKYETNWPMEGYFNGINMWEHLCFIDIQHQKVPPTSERER